MYYSDNPKGEYWGEQHRALDTAYVAAQYDVNDTEFTVPKADYILKGKIVDCFNYDRSYYNGTGTHTQFALGDYVKSLVQIVLDCMMEQIQTKQCRLLINLVFTMKRKPRI